MVVVHLCGLFIILVGKEENSLKNINLSFLYFSPIMTALLQEYENLLSQVTIIRLWWKEFKNQEDVNTSSKKAPIAEY